MWTAKKENDEERRESIDGVDHCEYRSCYGIIRFSRGRAPSRGVVGEGGRWAPLELIFFTAQRTAQLVQRFQIWTQQHVRVQYALFFTTGDAVPLAVNVTRLDRWWRQPRADQYIW